MPPLLALILLAAPAAQAGPAEAPSPPPAAPAYLDELLAAARARELWRERGWLRLGHWRRGRLGGWESEADGPAFFLAPDGKGDPAAELEATLRGFFAPEPLTSRDATTDHPQCRFPARLGYLGAALHLDPARLPLHGCPRFDAFWKRVGGRSVALVFSSYYLNNPASAFGHTFLRLGTGAAAAPGSGPGDRLDLVDQGVDYAATVTTSNAVLYIVKGLTGLFRGEFSARPYFYKVREYADYESRDLWEYELDLGPAERALLVGHLWELGQTWFDYFYLTENCSYHVLGALEAAAPRLELLSHLGPVTLPADAVKSLFANPGLVKAVRFRPSGRSQLAARARGLDGAELEEVLALAAGGEPPRLAGAPAEEQARLLDTALDLVDVRHGRAIVEGRDAAADALRQRLLERRAAVPVPSPPLQVDPPPGGGPEHGHGTLRVGAGVGGSSAAGPLVSLEWRLALHDLTDPPAGFSGRTQLEFLKVRGALAPRERWPRLEEATVVEAASLNVLDRFERRVSWKLRAGAARVYDAACNGCVAAQGMIGGGPAAVAAGEALAAAVTADAELTSAPDLRGAWGAPVRLGLGPGLLLRVLGGERAVLLGTAGWRWLPAASPRTTFQLGASARLHFGSASLGLDWRRTPLDQQLLLTAFAYGS